MASTGPSRKIRLNRLANVNYQHADFEKALVFLKDFGFEEESRTEDRVYFRGYNNEPYVYCAIKGDHPEFRGTTWVVDSLEDLELATEVLPNASKIYDVVSPGGGKGVTFKDPVDGFPFHLVYGQQLREISGDVSHNRYEFKELVPNYPKRKSRPANETVRMQKRPAPVHKLGHFGLCVTNYAAMYDFFTTYFNLRPSELVYNKAGEAITAFMHLDRGEEWVDHHIFFLFEGPKAHVHHSSFEVHDFDVQLLGHDYLRWKGYELTWGVGRHIMGSQIFDYWYDTSKFMLEHYADGDLVNDQTPTNHSEAHLDNLHVWGPDLPETFLQ
ncbi:hypothetical protein DV736_g4305, partial [Chaetothyriales sp. CBS 134916]